MYVNIPVPWSIWVLWSQVTMGQKTVCRWCRNLIFLISCWSDCRNFMGVSKKLWYPQIIHSNRVFHYKIINHSFWGAPIFGNTHIVGSEYKPSFVVDLLKAFLPLSWLPTSMRWNTSKVVVTIYFQCSSHPLPQTSFQEVWLSKSSLKTMPLTFLANWMRSQHRMEYCCQPYPSEI